MEDGVCIGDDGVYMVGVYGVEGVFGDFGEDDEGVRLCIAFSGVV